MPVGIQLAIAALAGAGLGFLLGWLSGRGRAVTVDDRLANELRQQLAQRETDLTKLRAELTGASTARASAEASRAAAERLVADQRAIHERTLQEAKLAQEKALADLREAFKGLSAEALKQSAPEFLRLANETFGKFQESAKGDLEKRQESIKVLVEPLKQQLETYQKRLQQSETTQSSALGEVKKQLETLAQSSQSLAMETQQFRMVLKSNQARGRWGEETLRRVVEAAGMSAHCDFSEQIKEGDSMPDLIVRLPGNRVIIVDAKVPDLDFLTAADVSEPARRADLLAAHAAKLRATIKGLAERNYPKQFPNALDHVVLFLPAESLFSTALEGDPELIVWAEARQVYLTTPASFIAVLRTINFIWQQHSQTENAREIAEAAQELYLRVITFTSHLENIRAGLETANKAFNQAVGSYESRLRPSGEKLRRLGGGDADKELADLQPLDTNLRLPLGD
jgi:DNA recombination protein RmuC